ncbi:hypothetical protein V2J09_012476 [Rumex salicifolius]
MKRKNVDSDDVAKHCWELDSQNPKSSISHSGFLYIRFQIPVLRFLRAPIQPLVFLSRFVFASLIFRSRDSAATEESRSYRQGIVDAPSFGF